MDQNAGPMPPQGKNSTTAIWSLILGVFGFFCLCPLGAIPAIICGHVGLSQIKRARGSLKGNGLAISGLVLGYFGVMLQFLIIPLLILPALLLPAIAKTRDLSIRAACQSNLHSFDIALVAYCYPPVEKYPGSLSELPSSDVGATMFVCPGSGTAQGDLADAGEWMDYIYVAGLGPAAPGGIPLIICPPENHKGLGGCVLDTDHSTRWRTKAEIDAIISSILSPTSKYTVVVSKRLTERSGGRYKSKP